MDAVYTSEVRRAIDLGTEGTDVPVPNKHAAREGQPLLQQCVTAHPQKSITVFMVGRRGREGRDKKKA